MSQDENSGDGADHDPVGADGAADQQSVAATLCDIVRYAPLAILLDGPSLLPQLAEQGKAHVRNARAVGPAVLRRVERRLRRDFGGPGTLAADLLRAAGMVPEAPPAAEPTAPTESAVPAASSDASTPVKPLPSVAVEDLAIPGYDSLSALQVVNRLPALSPHELAAVRDYESSTRGRKTILNKVAQLKA